MLEGLSERKPLRGTQRRAGCAAHEFAAISEGRERPICQNLSTKEPAGRWGGDSLRCLEGKATLSCLGALWGHLRSCNSSALPPWCSVGRCDAGPVQLCLLRSPSAGFSLAATLNCASLNHGHVAEGREPARPPRGGSAVSRGIWIAPVGPFVLLPLQSALRTASGLGRACRLGEAIIFP